MTRDQAISLVHGLVAIPSPSRHEHAASTWLVARMAAAGFDRAFVDAAGSAVGELGATDAPRLIVLLGHIDTVPGDIPVRIEKRSEPTTGAGATRDVEDEGEVLYGRGSVDAKGPLATFVAAGARLGREWAREAGVRLVVVGAVEEEAATSRVRAWWPRASTAATSPCPWPASSESRATGGASRSATRAGCSWT